MTTERRGMSVGEALDLARAKGLIREEGKCVGALLAPTAAPKGKRDKPALVEAAFVGPATWVVPVYVVAGDNARGQRAKVGRAGHERAATARVLATNLRALAPFADAAQRGERVRCVLTRLGGREMDDDGLHAAGKYVRDCVALFLGVGDGPRGPVRWEYRSEPGGANGVRIELNLIGPGTAS